MPKTDEDEIPFRPAFDLLAEEERRLAPEEASAIASALMAVLPEPSETLSAWRLTAREWAISRRTLS